MDINDDEWEHFSSRLSRESKILEYYTEGHFTNKRPFTEYGNTIEGLLILMAMTLTRKISDKIFW